MKIIKSRSIILMVLISLLLIFAACTNDDADSTGGNGGSSTEGNETETPKTDDEGDDEVEVHDPSNDEPVTIVIAYQWGEAAFNDRYGPIEEYLGNVNIEFVPSNGTIGLFEEMFAEGTYPDIIVDQNVFALQDLGVIHPLDEMLENSTLDIDMFNQQLLDSLKAYDSEGRIIGLPDGTSNIGLYINREVFDLFGVEHPDPEIPMTWPEVMDIARKMTGELNGTQYVGLANMDTFTLDQFAPNRTDPDTGEVLINQNDAFRQYFTLVEEYYSIPGMNDDDIRANAFPERRAAMQTATQQALNWLSGGESAETMDLVPYPVWPDMPNTGPLTGTTPMVITNYSENKEAALRVLEAYFEPEILLAQVRAGATAPPIDDLELQKQYAAEVEIYEGKNLDAYHVLQKAQPEERRSRWDGYVDLNSATQAIRDGTDVVTALRELEEESTIKIKDAMAAEE